MVESTKFKIGDKVFKPKGYKFPGTVVSIFKTTGGDIRIVAEMSDNGMLHIFNENQLDLIYETVVDNIPECERVAKSMLNNTILNKHLTLDEAKEKVINVIDEITKDKDMPNYLFDFWGNIRLEVQKM
jgi:hypothetical protein